MRPEEVVGFLLAAAAVVGAIAYLGRWIRTAVHAIDALSGLTREAAHNAEASAEIVSRELEANHGGSMKDDVSAIAHTVGRLWGRIDEIDNRLTEHLRKSR